MKWSPPDRLNGFAAKLLADQPDPPRKVSVADVLNTYVYLLVMLPFAAAFVVVGFVAHQPLLFAVVVLVASGLAFAGLTRLTATARWALRFGLASSGQVTSIHRIYRGEKSLTVRVDGPNGPVDTTLVRGDDTFVEEDVVQVMVDPETRQVLLMLALLKPSPLYAPPKE